MGLYDKHILPKIIEFLCSAKPIMYQRKKVVPRARGRVLEIGVGSGLNFQFYDPSSVQYIFGLDPSDQMQKVAEKRAMKIPIDVGFIDLSGDEIPLDSKSVDTVLVTYTLCTIENVLQALGEMRRVLKPKGELIFCEHGLAPDGDVRRWQNRVNPVWKQMAGGCRLNRPIPTLIEQGGFTINKIETMYIPGWKPATFNYWGSAIGHDGC